MRSCKRLYTAALHRFRPGPASDSLLVRPIQQLAQDVQTFDNEVVDRLVGLREQASAVSSTPNGEGHNGAASGKGIIHGSGRFGSVLERLADLLCGFEERLVLRGGSEGMQAGIKHLRALLLQIENLLAQPRYLILLIVATLVAIL